MNRVHNVIDRILPRGWLAGGEYLNLLLAWRCTWHSGRFGGGKTSIAFIEAAWLKAMGYVHKIHSNIPSMLNDPVTVPLRDAALVIDESWQILSSWKAVSEYAAFVRHLNLYLLLPSVYPPHPRMRFLSTQRTVNCNVVGLPLWIYKWRLGSGAVHEEGWFGFFRPEVIFPLYAQGLASGDGGIAYALKETYAYYIAEQKAIEKAKHNGQAALAESIEHPPADAQANAQANDETAELQQALGDAAESFSQASQDIKRAVRH